MTARDESKVSTLRFLKSALKYAAIEKKSKFTGYVVSILHALESPPK